MALAVSLVLLAVSQITKSVRQDDSAPVITAEEDTLEISCAYTPQELLAGVTASDDLDGDLTGQIMIGSFSHFVEPGVCDLNYVVFDSSDHMATLTRRVEFTDYHSPQFSLADGLNFAKNSSSAAGAEQLFSASDLLDGDLTDWIDFDASETIFNAVGDYTLHAEVRNSFGDLVGYDFPVHIYDPEDQSLSISLSQTLVYLEQGDSFNPMDYVKSVSDSQGNRYDPVLVDADSGVDPSTPGLYEVHYRIGSDTGTPYLPAEGQSQPNRLTWVGDSSLQGEMWLTVIVQEARA